MARGPVIVAELCAGWLLGPAYSLLLRKESSEYLSMRLGARPWPNHGRSPCPAFLSLVFSSLMARDTTQLG